ncbi:hypothetical protein NECAME_19542, partial [Necator americanus]
KPSRRLAQTSDSSTNWKRCDRDALVGTCYKWTSGEGTCDERGCGSRPDSGRSTSEPCPSSESTQSTHLIKQTAMVERPLLALLLVV